MSANPLIVPEAFDTIFVGGDQLPGLVNVGKPKRVFKWDKKEAPGTKGDSITYRGSRLVDFVIELSFWEADQIDAWDVIAPKLEPDERNLRAKDVIHPVLERLKVRSIVVAEIVPLWHEGGGLFKAQLGVNEYKPPPKAKANASPAGSSGGGNANGSGTGQAPPTAKTEQEKEIERLLAIARQP